MKGALIISHSPAKPGTAPVLQAERLEAAGIKAACFSNGPDADLGEALGSLAKEGADDITIIPLMFATGLGPSEPVPEEKRREILRQMGLPEDARIPEQKPLEIPEKVSVDGRDVPVRVGRPFGPEPGMRGVVESMLERLGADPARTAVIMVGHGSFDGSSLRAVDSNASYARDLGYQAIACANELEEPTVGQALEKALSLGKDEILVIPMFVSPSRHSSVEVPEKLGLPQGEREREETVNGRIVRIRYAGEVGLEPALADVLIAMVRE